jgi:ubiquitin carboxyl-terminal hydrolase 4/11
METECDENQMSRPSKIDCSDIKAPDNA